MTDTKQKRIKLICEVAHIDDISDLSDGFHTFKQLYYQRMMLFATIVKQNKDKAWKSLRHEDGELCFGGGWFIVGIDTPEGSYTYHYEDNFYSLFDCIELECSKHWDGHTEKDVTRLLSLEQEPCEDAISRETVVKYIKEKCNPYGKPSIDFEAGKKAIEYFKALPPVTPTQRWIPVNERLPEESGLYLVTIRLTFSKDDKYVSVKDSDDWELLEKCGHEVIAWMLLPEPYVESEA